MTEAFDSRQFLASLSHHPGVYRMLDEAGEILYVGKAGDLKRRVASYFSRRLLQPKTQALMQQTARVEVTITGSEREALLLEHNLIKLHQPAFNVLLRDDKSYPYIYVSTQLEFPRVELRRGQRRGPGRFLGPFPNACSVRETLQLVYKLFRIRQCSDAFFANRTRACLQYQIRRCSAPCVGLISSEAYRRDVADALLFLEGRNAAVLARLMARMENAAGELDFEGAATYRDQIAAIKHVQAEQMISGRPAPDTDVLAAHIQQGLHCITQLIIRGGRVLGTRDFFPHAAAGTGTAELLGAFIGQHYPGRPAPREIIVPLALEELPLLEAALTAQAGHPVRIRHRVRGLRRRWLDMAAANARQAVVLRGASGTDLRKQLEALRGLLKLDEIPERIECFDISHIAGSDTIGACVVFGVEGPRRQDYRRFGVRDLIPGDDCRAIAQVVLRRYRRVARGEGVRPDLIIIDGGAGQLASAAAALDELQLTGIPLLAMAKGSGRRPGEERLWLPGRRTPLRLAPNAPALHLLQQVRDEAHRFAVAGHRQRRGRVRLTSELEGIAGLGPVRRRALLRHFGGLRGIRQAGIGDLTRVPGISGALARRIYTSLHGAEPG